MKKILFFLILATAGYLQAATENRETSYNDLLGKYVRPDGVRYAAWKANTADAQALKNVTEQIARPQAKSGNQPLEFYINAYNAWTLHNVLEAYPIKSIRDVYPLFGFFTRKTITVDGKKMSLNELEKGIIIARFHEPRVHAAINCASRSCPALANEVFSGNKLDAQLTRQFTNFVSKNPLGVAVSKDGKSAAVSSIFKWYADDFKPAGGAVAYINQFRKDKLNSKINLTFQDYDWNLNEAK